MAIFSNLKILSTFNRYIMDDDKAAMPHTLRSFFPVVLMSFKSISSNIVTSISHTSFLVVRSEGLNSKFNGGSEIILESIADILLSSVCDMYAKMAIRSYL